MSDERYRDRVDALEAAWACWAATGSGLDAEGWRTPSRCGGWDVAALFAHVAMFPGAALTPPPAPDPPGAPVTAAQILAGFNAPGGAAHEFAAQIASAAVETARTSGTDAVVAAFAETGPQAVARLREHGADDLLTWPAAQAVTTWGEAIRIVLLESVVHLLDVLDALGRPPDVPGTGAREVAHLLAETVGPVRFVEAASGRSTEPVLPVLR